MKKSIVAVSLVFAFLTIALNACAPISTSASPTLSSMPSTDIPEPSTTPVIPAVVTEVVYGNRSPIPEDTNPGGREERLDVIYAPSGFTTVLGWLQAATLSKTQQGEPALIIIDYMNLIEKRADGSEYIVYNEDYNLSQPYLQDGGLFIRSPRWFDTDDSTPIYNSEIKDGFLILDASATPDNILHWWTDRVYCDPHARYFLEISVKIEGAAGLQLGSDYWVDMESQNNGWDEDCQGVNNCEAWSSNWYGDTEGQFITIKAPLH